MPKPSLLDPVVIAQLGNLQLRARRILEGLYSGHHVNLARGQSQDFSEHRPYNPGDDPRGLDWKIFGRTDRLVIKQYEEQTNVAAAIVIDDSASMSFSWDGRMTKLEYAKTMAAAMAYLISAQHDAVGLFARDVRIPPASHRGSLDRLFGALETVTPAGAWNFDALAENVTAYFKRPGFVLVFSDLLSEPERVLSALRALHARKHEVLVFQVFDPAERDLPFDGPVIFHDMETGEELRTEPAAIRDSYRRLVSQRVAALEHTLRTSGMDYLFVTTDTAFDRGLGAFLSWRQVRI